MAVQKKPREKPRREGRNGGKLRTGGTNKGGTGRPPEWVKELAREHTETSIDALAEIVRDKESPPSARTKAAEVLLDRGWGKPTQEITGKDGKDLMPEVSLAEIVARAGLPPK